MQAIDSGTPVLVFALPTVAFAPHGNGSRSRIKKARSSCLKTMTGKEILTLHGHHGPISSIAFSPTAAPAVRRPRYHGDPVVALPEKPACRRTGRTRTSSGSISAVQRASVPHAWALMAHPDRAVKSWRSACNPMPAPRQGNRRTHREPQLAEVPKRDAAIRRLKEIAIARSPP